MFLSLKGERFFAAPPTQSYDKTKRVRFLKVLPIIKKYNKRINKTCSFINTINPKGPAPFAKQKTLGPIFLSS